jgi:hypothetical protein
LPRDILDKLNGLRWAAESYSGVILRLAAEASDSGRWPMRGYEGIDPADVTAMFRIAYDVAIRRCDVCERCGKAPVSKALRIKDPVYGAFDTPSNLLAVCNGCYEAGRGELISN